MLHEDRDTVVLNKPLWVLHVYQMLGDIRLARFAEER
jgi:hypothetical protein